MIIQKQSLWSGNVNQMDLPVTEEQIEKWRSGTLIQKAMPHLTAEEREFLISGTTPADWAEMFPPVDESIYLHNESGNRVECSKCGEFKLLALCTEVEFNCDKNNQSHQCENWSGSCCDCGADYAKGQM